MSLVYYVIVVKFLMIIDRICGHMMSLLKHNDKTESDLEVWPSFIDEICCKLLVKAA